MGLFSKKSDPIASKARELEEQIAAVQLQIKKLNRKLDKPEPSPRSVAPTPTSHTNGHDHAMGDPPLRSTALPHGARVAPNRSIAPREPIFESVDQGVPAAQSDPSQAHFNDLGVRKYDLPAA